MFLNKKFFTKLGVLALAIFSCGVAAEGVFALEPDFMSWSVSDFNRAIENLKEEQNKAPVEDVDYNKVAEILELERENAEKKELIRKKMDGLSSKEKRSIRKSMAGSGFSRGGEVFDLVDRNFWNRSNFFGLNDFFDGFEGLGNFVKGMGNFVKGLGKSFDMLNSELPEEVRKFQKSKKTGVLILDGNGNKKHELKFSDGDPVFERFRTDVQKEGSEFAIKSLLSHFGYEGEFNSLKKGGYTIVIKPSRGQIACFKRTANGSENNVYMSGTTYFSNFKSDGDGTTKGDE